MRLCVHASARKCDRLRVVVCVCVYLRIYVRARVVGVHECVRPCVRGRVRFSRVRNNASYRRLGKNIEKSLIVPN